MTRTATVYRMSIEAHIWLTIALMLRSLEVCQNYDLAKQINQNPEMICDCLPFTYRTKSFKINLDSLKAESTLCQDFLALSLFFRFFSLMFPQLQQTEGKCPAKVAVFLQY